MIYSKHCSHEKETAVFARDVMSSPAIRFPGMV